MSVYTKLLKVQATLKAPKGQKNSFGNYRYRSCEDILEALKPILVENDATIFISDTLQEIGGERYICSTVTFVDVTSGTTIQNTAYAREALEKKGMDVSQVTGATSSYARKYALNGMFCIDDTKDADTDEYTKQGRQSTPKTMSEVVAENERKNAEGDRKITAGLFKELNQLLMQKVPSDSMDGYIKKLCNGFGVTKLQDITISQFEALKNRLEVA